MEKTTTSRRVAKPFVHNVLFGRSGAILKTLKTFRFYQLNLLATPWSFILAANCGNGLHMRIIHGNLQVV